MEAMVMNLAAAMLALAAAVLPATQSAAEQNTNVLVKFDIGREGRLIILPVTVTGQDYPFLFDTGANHTVYDTSLASHLGESRGTMKAREAGGIIMEMRQFASIPAKLGPLSIQTEDPVLSLDLEPIRQAAGQDIRGLLSFALFRKHVVQIDFDAGRFVIFAPASSPDRAWGKPVPFNYDPKVGNPWVTATLMDNATYLFLVDTGMIGTGSLSPPLFSHLFNKGVLSQAGESSYIGAAGERRARMGWLSSIGIGPFRHQRQCFGEAPECALGLDYWSRYRITLDFPNRILYLKKGKRYAEPDRQGLSGLSLRRMDDKVVVHSLRAGSPADKAGVRPGDVILAIQDKPAVDCEFFDLSRRLFVEEGRRIHMTLSRDGETVPVSFVLEPRSQDWSASQTGPEGTRDPSRGAGAFQDLPSGLRLSPLQAVSRPAAGEQRTTGRQRDR